MSLARMRASPDEDKLFGPLISSIGPLNAFIKDEYHNDDLALRPLHAHLGFRSHSRGIIVHHWSFRGIYTVQLGAADINYPRSVVLEMLEETKRWIDAFIAEGECDSKTRL